MAPTSVRASAGIWQVAMTTADRHFDCNLIGLRTHELLGPTIP